MVLITSSMGQVSLHDKIFFLGRFAYFSSFTIVRGVMEHHIKEFDIYLINVFHNSFMEVLAANYKGVK